MSRFKTKNTENQHNNDGSDLIAKENSSLRDKKSGEISRLDFFKSVGAGAAVAGMATACSRNGVNEGLEDLEGTNLAMVIDLQRCTGCGGCDLACKSENNLRENHFWSHHITKTSGEFPHVRYEYMPTLCNHCEKAPCIKACPTSAMHKVAGGVTAHDPDKCIGCRACIINCPYGEVHANFGKPHSEWDEIEEMIAGVTGSPKSTVKDVGDEPIPYYNNERENFATGDRYHGIVEKCDFCAHRLKEKKLPACVKRCPTDARIFGDLNDPNSSVSRILAKYRPFRRMENLGTQPKVFYVRSFNSASAYEQTKGELAENQPESDHRGFLTPSDDQKLAERFDNDAAGKIEINSKALQEQLFG